MLGAVPALRRFIDGESGGLLRGLLRAAELSS
jgi:hypothetical protein